MAKTEKKSVPVCCDICRADLWFIESIEGDLKVTTWECRTEGCSFEPQVERFRRKPVNAFLCGPGTSGGLTHVGDGWVQE